MFLTLTAPMLIALTAVIYGKTKTWWGTP